MRTAAAAVLSLALGLAGGSAAGGAWEGHLRAQLAATQAALLEAQERVGAGCEPVYMAAWPDGGCAARLSWPPVACEVAVRVYRHPDQTRVLERVRAGGPRLGLTLYEERGARERALSLRWNPEVSR